MYGVGPHDGRANLGPGKKQKKEEFPGTMRCMPAGNSFPQICVVSETHSAELEDK
jgi:hypothetical protein